MKNKVENNKDDKEEIIIELKGRRIEEEGEKLC